MRGGRTGELQVRALRLKLANALGVAAPRQGRAAPHGRRGQTRETSARLLVVEHAVHLERGVRWEMTTLVHEHLELEHRRAAFHHDGRCVRDVDARPAMREGGGAAPLRALRFERPGATAPATAAGASKEPTGWLGQV